MIHKVDARGLACPQPVMNAVNALETHSSIIVIVDNDTALENIRRMANTRGYHFSDEKKADGIYIILEKLDTSDAQNNAQPDISECSNMTGRVLVISQDIIGRGDDSLGTILMKSFMHTLAETGPAPDAIIFLNSGVKLAVDGSEVLEDLKTLEGNGKKILACGTCLDFFKIKDKLKVGSVTNMYEIKELMLSASSTINI